MNKPEFVYDESVLYVKAICGEKCYSHEQGEKLFDRIAPAIIKSNHVKLQFGQVEKYDLPFFDSAVGPIARRYSKTFLFDHVTFLGLDASGEFFLNKALENCPETSPEDKCSPCKCASKGQADLEMYTRRDVPENSI